MKNDQAYYGRLGGALVVFGKINRHYHLKIIWKLSRQFAGLLSIDLSGIRFPPPRMD